MRLLLWIALVAVVVTASKKDCFCRSDPSSEKYSMINCPDNGYAYAGIYGTCPPSSIEPPAKCSQKGVACYKSLEPVLNACFGTCLSLAPVSQPVCLEACVTTNDLDAACSKLC